MRLSAALSHGLLRVAMTRIGRGVLADEDEHVELEQQLNLFQMQQNRLCMRRRSPSTTIQCLYAPPPAPFWRICTECGAGCDHFNGPSFAAEARRISADGCRGWSICFARFRWTSIQAPRSASTIRPAPPSAGAVQSRYNIEELDFLRPVPAAGSSSMSAPMSAPMRWRWRVMSAPAAR